MFRIAVIQNGVEMQHAGYVDAVPKYSANIRIAKEEVIFKRFSSTNIKELFCEGKDFLLEYDALIIGTNATSDDDVYQGLLDSSSRDVLARFIDMGKGLLICSQKKYKEYKEQDGVEQLRITIEDDTGNFKNDFENNRKGTIKYSSEVVDKKSKKFKKSGFLPCEYEYKALVRPEKEESSDPGAHIVKSFESIIQEFILSVPYVIDDDLLSERCEKNPFQKHYYRDYIEPINSSRYFSLVFDTGKDGGNRPLVMVSSPLKKERIVISTMALDWAAHDELISNIIEYIVRGLPSVGFINKKLKPSKEMEFLINEANLEKLAYTLYTGIEKFYDKSSCGKYHSLVIFSPEYTEDEVNSEWLKIKEDNKFLRAYYYKRVGTDLALMQFSNYSFVEKQKIKTIAWLESKFGSSGKWSSFWKSYSVLFSLESIGYENLKKFLPAAYDAFTDPKLRFKEGSYDRVLAPTCALFEFLCLLQNEKYKDLEIKDLASKYKKTEKWLLEKYDDTSSTDYNRQFIIRSFFRTGKENVLIQYLGEKRSLADEFARIFESEKNIYDKRYDIDICLQIEICFLYRKYCKGKTKDIDSRIMDCLKILVGRQENEKWGSLNNTAMVLYFLLQNIEQIKELYPDNDARDNEELSKIQKAIAIGFSVIRRECNGDNWENSIATTANALKVIVKYDSLAEYKSKDFLNDFVTDAEDIATYNSLGLALDSLEKSVDENHKLQKKVKDYERDNEELKNNLIGERRKLAITATISTITIALVLSLYIYLLINDMETFVSMVSQPLMWIPVVVGAALTGAITIIRNKIVRTGNKVVKVDKPKKVKKKGEDK